MNRLRTKSILSVMILAAFAPHATGQTQIPTRPNILAIAGPAGTNAPGKLVSISANGRREIAELSGHVLFGSDAETVAFLQTPFVGSRSGSRLLVVDRKTFAVIADQNVTGFVPDNMIATDASMLAVHSKESIVYIPVFDGHDFGVVEANWKTAAIRVLNMPFAGGARRYEMAPLHPVPSGILVERGPFYTLFDPMTQTAVLDLQSPIGPDLHPTSGYYAVPGFGLVESSDGIFSRITREDFRTLIPNPKGFPNLETNRLRRSWRLGWIIEGKPCLIWGENEDGLQPQNLTISRIAVFDLESKSIMLRKSLGGDFSSAFLPDAAGENIYFLNPQTGEIICLNLKTEKPSSFAKLALHRFDAWVAAN
jgi:hypothetical protein